MVNDMTSKIFKPPMDLPFPTKGRYSIFLAGSIELGKAKMWQAEIETRLKDVPVDIFNPRRDNWDWSTEQSANNPIFREQVLWELNALEEADYILMVFDPNTKSPISLMELGLFAHSKRMIVVCPEGFWRKGNVDIVCQKFNILQFDNANDAVQHIVETQNYFLMR